MDIDELTIGQAKELASMFGGEKAADFDNGMIGKYVIVRCRDAGVHAGILEKTNGRECVLTDARRLWYWKTTGTGDFLNSIALNGVHSASKLSEETPRIALTENCEIIQCTDVAEKSIRGLAAHNG